MNALVKLHAEPGLWLADVPEPECGINDVLIRVLRTGICGTDLHIRNWDAWASRTIPVPMVIGHEFVGEVVSVGSNVPDFHPGEVVSRRGPCRLRPLPQLHGRPPPPVRAHVGRRRQPAGRVRRADRPADDEHLASPRRGRPRRRVDLRPVRQRGAHRAAVPGAGRGRADHRRRADRLHGGRRRPPRRRAVRRRHPTSTPSGARWPSGWARPSTFDPRETTVEQVQAELGHGRGLRRRPGDVGQRAALRVDGDEHGPRRADRRARPADRRHRHRLDAADHQHADDPRHLRPRDVRDLVPDDRDAAVGAGHRPGDHAPVRVRRLRGGVRRRRLRLGAAR